MDKCRAVTLLCTTHKILEYVLSVKSVPYAEVVEGEYQGSFRRRGTTVDQIFYYETNNGKCWEQNSVVQYLFTDFQAAHDTVC